ncbi:MAG: hypothetical protein ACK40X_12080, partial [Armatimonadota bacterium]
LPAGIHLFTVPLLPTAFDEAEALGIPPDELLLARWNPLRAGDFKYEFYPRITTPMMPGVGYWIKLLRERTIRVEGTPVPSDQPYEIPLYGGFNQVGNPFARDLPVGEILVMFGNEGPVGLSEAERNGWVQNAVWVWDKTQGYQLAQTVRQWQGFWVRALRASGVRLVFNWSRGRFLAGRVRKISDDGLMRNHSIRWSLRLSVTAPNSPPDTENLLGVASASRLPSRISKPPMVVNSVWAAFLSDGEALAHDFKSERSNLKWTFVVKSDLPDNTPVTLRWEGLTQVPRSIAIVATDLTTGERFSLRSRSNYTFNARKGEMRQFAIEARQVPSAPLLRIVSVQSLRGRGLTANLVLTAPAHVRAEIKTLTGRTVRVLTETFVTRLPSFTIFWDGRDLSGKPLPLGAYMLIVNARDELGREQRVIRTVMVK